MSTIEKQYFNLAEVEAAWALPRRDIAYLAENGLLALSARLCGVHLELGSYELLDDDRWCSLPEERVWFHGLKDLRPDDLFRLFVEGEWAIRFLAAPQHRYCRILEPLEGIWLKPDWLLVRREERERVAIKYGLGGLPRATDRVLRQEHGFSHLQLGERIYKLGRTQARVVQILYESAVQGVPWLCGKVVLARAGSSCTRIADLFKKQPGWRMLIQSDRRGNYRLNLDFS